MASRLPPPLMPHSSTPLAATVLTYRLLLPFLLRSVSAVRRHAGVPATMDSMEMQPLSSGEPLLAAAAVSMSAAAARDQADGSFLKVAYAVTRTQR